MPSHKKNDMEQFTILDENPEPTNTTLTAEELSEMQAMKEEMQQKFAALTQTTTSGTSSAEQIYPSPPHSTAPTDLSVMPKKRSTEDELSSPTTKKVMIRAPHRKIVGDFRGHVRKQLLQDEMAAKIRLNEAKKKDPSAGAFEHLPDIDPNRPLDCKIDARKLWDEDSLKLGQYPRLVTTKLTYRYKKLRNPWFHNWEYVCFPIAPADDIEKSLHLAGGSKHIKWTGFWAEQKLQKEIAKYERIKEFWLFNYSINAVVPFFAGLDKKEEFVVGLFPEELESPWVRAWLREFLGDDIMDEIVTAMKSVDEASWKKASDNMLHHQGRWESLCLRFKSRASLV